MLRSISPCLLLLGALVAGCADETFQQGDGSPPPKQDTSTIPVPDGYGPLWPCTEVGKACNAHDTCAINPVCGKDKLCRPESLQSCDDGLDCTQDLCKGMGLCEYKPTAGYCALPVTTGGSDGSAGKTEIKCFTKGTAKPGDPCKLCDPDQSGTKWTGANGGSCDDNNTCTKDDYCTAGVCKGTYYGNACADGIGCTEDLCDGNGGCLGNKLKSDWCLINGACYKDKSNNPSGSCQTCDVTKTQSAWTSFSNSCQIDGMCYKTGDKHPLQCAECDPATSKTSWTVKGTTHCFIDKVCKKSGEKDTIGCAVCDPTKDKNGWTPLSNLCKIGGKCYQKGDKHTGGCAECDPAVSGTAWTVKGTTGCLIDDKCYKSADKDSIKCSTCDPTKDKYDWTPIAGLCKISGSCYNKGAKHPGGCAECDPAVQSTAWTVKTTTACLVNNICRKPSDKDLSGCGSCVPTANKYAWTPLSGLCKIDGSCYAKGATHPGGCATCDPAKSATAWTPSGSGCVIDLKCYASGAQHPGGCGSCNPGASTTQWTVTGSNCAIGAKCYAQGTLEPSGCGTCDPSKSQTAWTKGSGCLLTHAWSRSFGSTSSDYPYGVAVDANGNVYVTGYFYYSVDFGGGTLTSKGSYDIFVASYTPGGQHRWSKSFGSTSSDYGYAIAVDGNGNVYVTGRFYGSVSFGGATLTASSTDAFLVSFTSDGMHRWSKKFGGTSSDYGYGVATDSAGNVYVTGYFYGSVSFGGTTLTSSSGDAFLASYTSAGAHRWSKNFGGTSSDYGYAVAVDGSSNVYLTGYFYNTINFGGSALTSKGSYDIFLASFTSTGAHRWSKSFGNTSSDYGYGVAVDNSGNVYITGTFYYSADFGGGTLTPSGYRDAYLASYTSGGTHRWSKNYGGSSSDYGYGVTTDGSGNVYFTGYYYTSIKFGSQTLTSAGGYDAFLASFTSTGAHRWSRSYGSTSTDQGRAVAVDSAGNVYAAGYFYYTVDFGGGPLTSKGSYDIYLLKLAP